MWQTFSNIHSIDNINSYKADFFSLTSLDNKKYTNRPTWGGTSVAAGSSSASLFCCSMLLSRSSRGIYDSKKTHKLSDNLTDFMWMHGCGKGFAIYIQ